MVSKDPSEADRYEKKLLLSVCIQFPTEDGVSPIKRAINASNLKWVKLFIQNGADVNHRSTSSKGTPI